MIHLYVDGSFSKKKNKGAYSVLVFRDQSKDVIKEDTGIVRFATSNKCELTGLIRALEICSEARSKEFIIHCDSQYCVNAYNNWMDKWKLRNWHKSNGRQVKNLDLVKRLYDLKYGGLTDQSVIVKWVRGHNGDARNEMADQAAKNLVYE